MDKGYACLLGGTCYRHCEHGCLRYMSGERDHDPLIATGLGWDDITTCYKFEVGEIRGIRFVDLSCEENENVKA